MFPLLDTLVAVYEIGQFTLAADELKVSQSTVSSRIAQLERIVGAPLFVRNAKSDVTPTEAGRLLYRAATGIDGTWRDACEQIARMRESREPLSVAFSHTTAAVLLPVALPVMAEVLSGFDCSIRVLNSDAILEQTGMKAVQLGVVEKPIVNDSVDRVTLREDRLVLAGDPHGVWMVREHGSGVRYYTDLYFKTVGSMPSRMIEVANNAAIGAALGLLVSWGGQLAGLLGTLDADLVAGIGKGIAAFMALRGAVGAAIIGFANLKEAWALLTAAFSANPYLLAIGAAVTLAVVVMDNWGAVKAFLLGVWDAVASGVRAAVDAVASAFDNAVNFVTGAGSAIAGAVGPAVSSAMGFAGAAVSGAADLLASAFGGAADVVSGLFSGMGAAIGIALQGIMDGFRLLGGLAAAIFSGDLSGALDAGIGLFRNFGETALGVFPALGEGILGGLSSLWGRVTEAFPDFGAWASGVAEAVGSAFSGAAEAVAPAVSGLAEAAVSAFGGVADTLGAAFGDVAGAASSAFSGALDMVGPAASEAADRLSSALSGAVAFVSGRFPSLGAAAEAVGQGLASEFQSIRDLVASVFSGDLSGALDAALGLFSGFRETAFAIFSALGEAVLGVFAFVWGQVTASFPDFGAWAASSASAVAGAFGKALGWVREKLYGLVDMLPDWALEKLGWKRLPDAGAEDGMPGFRAPYAHGGQGAPAGNGGSGYGGLSSGNAWGAGSAAGVSSGGAWGAGSVGGTPSDGAFAGAPAGGLGTGGSGAGSFGADGPGGPFFPGASGGSFGGAPGSSGQGRAPGGGSSRAGLFGPGFGTQPFFSPSTEAYLMAAPWQSAAMASAGGAVSLESRTEINVSGASSPDEVARRVAVEQDNINADLIRYAQGAAR